MIFESSALMRARRRLLNKRFRFLRAGAERWTETVSVPESSRFTLVVDRCINVILSNARKREASQTGCAEHAEGNEGAERRREFGEPRQSPRIAAEHCPAKLSTLAHRTPREGCELCVGTVRLRDNTQNDKKIVDIKLC